MTLSGTSANGTVVPVTVQVTVGSTELKVNPLPNREGDRPGSTIEAPVTISNTGSLPAEGVQLRMLTTLGLSYENRFSNCVYSTVTSDPRESYAPQQALCTFDTVIEPGKSYRLDRPVGLDVGEDALFEYFGREALPVSGADATPPSGNGSALSLVPAGDAAADATEVGRQEIDVANTADMVAGGDTAEGAPGDMVYVDVSLSNEGPGRVGYINGDFYPSLVLTVPTGAKAVEIPDQCSVWSKEASSGTGEKTPGAPEYICVPRPSEFTVGDIRTYRFGLQVRDNAVTTTGQDRRARRPAAPELRRQARQRHRGRHGQGGGRRRRRRANAFRVGVGRHAHGRRQHAPDPDGLRRRRHRLPGQHRRQRRPARGRRDGRRRTAARRRAGPLREAQAGLTGRQPHPARSATRSPRSRRPGWSSTARARVAGVTRRRRGRLGSHGASECVAGGRGRVRRL